MLFDMLSGLAWGMQMTIATKLEMIPSLVAQFVEEVLSGDVWETGEVKIRNLDCWSGEHVLVSIPILQDTRNNHSMQ